MTESADDLMPGMVRLSKDEYAPLWWNLPMTRPQNPASAAEAMTIPGCCVKSVEREKPMGFPRYYGRVLLYDPDGDDVCVIAHPDGRTPFYFRWRGCVREYQRLWECD